MAQADRTSRTRVSDRLMNSGESFEFFQAVRMLEMLARESRDARESPFAQIGDSAAPAEEAIRFRGHPSLTFSPSEIHEIGGLKSGEPVQEGQWPVGLEVAFLGLIGPQGALPQHYTSLVIERVAAGDHTLRELLDLFHHRAVSLFYRAWEKYRLPPLFERYHRRDRGNRDEIDPVSFVLQSFVGLSTTGLQQQLAVDDETVTYYSGHFANQVRSASALETLLSDYFAAPVSVLQFQGRWITLAPDERTSLPSRGQPLGQHRCLGRDAIVGSRVWNVPTKFRVRIGPLNLEHFTNFLPGTPNLRKLCDLARLYAGPEFSFDVQVVLRREDVPCAKLGGQAGSAPRLGWNSWSRIRPYVKDGDEAIFHSPDD